MFIFMMKTLCITLGERETIRYYQIGDIKLIESFLTIISNIIIYRKNK